MVIREMSREECLKVLAGARLARLGCAHEGQPYVVPVYLAYQGPPDGEAALYGFTSLGQKIEWMRANPLVCVEVDEVAAYNQWVSIIAFGRYEELPEAPGCDDKRRRAWQVLQTHPMWQEPGLTAWASRAHCDPAKPLITVFYRIRIDRVTGHEATQDAQEAISSAVPTPPVQTLSWMRTLTRLCGGSPK